MRVWRFPLRPVLASISEGAPVTVALRFRKVFVHTELLSDEYAARAATADHDPRSFRLSRSTSFFGDDAILAIAFWVHNGVVCAPSTAGSRS